VYDKFKKKEIDAIRTGEKQAEDNINSIFKKFIKYKIRFDKISKNSVIHYNNCMKSFMKCNADFILNEKNIQKGLENFIEKTQLSDNSINIVLNGLRVFFYWASAEEQQYIAKKDYIKKYKRKTQKTIKEPYTEGEYKMFIDYFEKNNKKEICYLIQFLWNTGARIGETLNIKISDINFENSYISISNKIFKGQQETLLLTAEAKEIIEKVIEFRSISGDDKLFSWNSYNGLVTTLHRVENKLNIRIKGRGFHGFRRSFATKLFEKRFDMPEVQEIMRHRTITTTLEHYKEFNKANLINKMNEKL
jgi:integrase/recombinase XerD